MVMETNAFNSTAAAGNKEDISDVIYNVDPYDCPFLTSIDDAKADNKLHQWQTDVLAAASSTNYHLEGDAESADAQTATTVVSNTCQISKKIPRVSGSQQAISHYGREDEMAYLQLKAAKELRTDMETQLLANNAEVTGDTTTIRELGGIGAWLITNVDKADDGTTGTGLGNTARTDGTARAFTESQLKSVLRKCWDSGGNPDVIMLGSFNKQQMSTFAGNGTRYSENDGSLETAIDIYKSDFGQIDVLPNRFQRASDGLVLQKDLFAVAYLRRPHVEELAKTGDARIQAMRVEYTLECRNEAGSGIVADLTSS